VTGERYRARVEAKRIAGRWPHVPILDMTA